LEITVNGCPRQTAEGITIEQLLEELGMAGRFVAVEVNLELAPRAQHREQRLAVGDRVEIVTLVGGG
jgi:sulfur carrier protein